MITEKMLTDAKLCTADLAAKWAPHLAAACKTYGIDTPARIAAFLAQCAHESGHFKAVEENLNYGAQGLMKTWPKRFDAATAAACARKPEMIANRVYASRMGNGDVASGEGWKYRGRGLIQLTGKENYTRFSKAIGKPEIVAKPELVAQPEMAALSAAWFWDANGLNALADKGDIVAMTKRINGGTIGLPDRQALYDKALTAMA